MSTPGPVRVGLSASLALRLAAVVLGTLAVLTALQQARTVLHWLVTAAVAALLLDGPVRALAGRGVPRGLAVGLVTVAAVVGAALLTYGVVDAVVQQYRHLQATAPEAAQDLARTGPVPELWQRVRLVERTSALLDEAPGRLFGSPASVARTAAERLGEVVLVLTLTVFLLVTYERFEARWQRLTEAGVLWRWSSVDAGIAAGARRARLVVARAVMAGVVTAAVAQAVDVPAPVVLGLWTAWWRLLPVAGVVVGGAPVVLLLGTGQPVAVAVAALLVLAAAEAVASAALAAVQPPDEDALPSRFLSAAAFAAGFEMAGVAGSVVAVVLVHLAVGVAMPVRGGRPAPGAALPRQGPPALAVTPAADEHRPRRSSSSARRPS